MKHAPWLYAAPESWPATPEGGEPGVLRLSREETHHAVHALRLRSGAEVCVFDGEGRLATARLSEDGSDGGAVCRLARIRRVRKNRPRLLMATATPKGKRAAWLVEKCTEAGVDALRPIVFARSVAGVDAGDSSAAKWREWSLAAGKQCQRAHLPKILAPQFLGKWLAALTTSIVAREADNASATETAAKVSEPPLLLYGAPDGLPFSDWSERAASSSRVAAVVGPEGGLTPEEEALLRSAGAVPARWGPHIYRVETAAVAACVAVGLLRKAR